MVAQPTAEGAGLKPLETHVRVPTDPADVAALRALIKARLLPHTGLPVAP